VGIIGLWQISAIFYRSVAVEVFPNVSAGGGIRPQPVAHELSTKQTSKPHSYGFQYGKGTLAASVLLVIDWRFGV
jgi:hypothetical protein